MELAFNSTENTEHLDPVNYRSNLSPPPFPLGQNGLKRWQAVQSTTELLVLVYSLSFYLS